MNETAKIVGLGEGDERRAALPATVETAALTPMNVLNQAVTSGASVDVIERLMGLQERWEKNQARKAFDAALSAAKAKIPVIRKTRGADFGTTRSGSTGAKYAYEDLGEIAETVQKILGDHGLSFRWRTLSAPAAVTVTCIISHELGHSEENSLSAPFDVSGGKNPIQAIGSTVTYLQRYTIKAALGLAASADDDGHGAGAGSSGAPKRPREQGPSASGKQKEPAPNQEDGAATVYVPQAFDGAPRPIPHVGRPPEDWTDDYMATLRKAADTQEIIKWSEQNAVPLGALAGRYPDFRATIDKLYNELLSRGSAPKEKGPSANAPDATAEPASEIDSSQWRKDMEGALSGCESTEELDKIRATIAAPPDGVFKSDIDAVNVAFHQAVDRIVLGK